MTIRNLIATTCAVIALGRRASPLDNAAASMYQWLYKETPKPRMPESDETSLTRPSGSIASGWVPLENVGAIVTSPESEGMGTER
jgi:hypothetical protein